MTNPNDIYRLTPESISNNLEYIANPYFNHVSETIHDFSLFHVIRSDQIEIRIISEVVKYHRSEVVKYHRIVWRLATVWFDNKPVMVIQNAGKYGHEHSKKFVTDRKTYKRMCDHIKELISIENEDDIKEIDADKNIKGLVKFYGHRIYDSLEGERMNRFLRQMRTHIRGCQEDYGKA